VVSGPGSPDPTRRSPGAVEPGRGQTWCRRASRECGKRPASTPSQGQLSGRMRAALAVIKTTPNHKASQTTLSSGMQRDRTWIAQVGALMPPPHWAIPTLTGLLRDPRPETRQLAAEALGRIRAPGAIVLAFLEGTTRDSDARVRKAALRGPHSNPVRRVRFVHTLVPVLCREANYESSTITMRWNCAITPVAMG
jgi:hypothetical protein